MNLVKRRKRKPFSPRLSVRSLLLCVSTSTIALGVFAHARQLTPSSTANEVKFGLVAMVVLLVITCFTFASVAHDVWRDPEATFVAGIIGVLGFALLVMFGLLMPMTVA